MPKSKEDLKKSVKEKLSHPMNVETDFTEQEWDQYRKMDDDEKRRFRLKKMEARMDKVQF